ncbi:hypothetical protein SKAU_G00190380 [Synaphobranchus kaupii]|uniref:FH2 domain-containing protein n=1 Tax=Synaphobranchus kaupii TaxID=118154 RepID=A0A9Q1IWA9_SYNKA|nr:hypothetical protein SKAU_G00190380 [Synaphobranchus kaupii]
MENVNSRQRTEGKYPPGSFLDKISTLFVRAEKQEPQTQTGENTVLTAFRNFPDKKACNGVDKGNDDPAGEGNLWNGAEGQGENGDLGTSDAEELGDRTQGEVDADLVQVCMVEIHSDTETEDEEGSGLVQSEEVIRMPHPPEEDGGRVKPISDQCGAEIETKGGTVDENIEEHEVQDVHVFKLHIYLGKASEKMAPPRETEGSLAASQTEPDTWASEDFSGSCRAGATPADEGCEVPAGARTPYAALSDHNPPAASTETCSLHTPLPSAVPTGPPRPSEPSSRTAVDCSLAPALNKPPVELQTTLQGPGRCPPRAEGRLPPTARDYICVPVGEDVVNKDSVGSDCSADGSPGSPCEFPCTPAAQTPSETEPGEGPDPTGLPFSSQDTDEEECPSGAKEGQGCCSQGCSSAETEPASKPPQPSERMTGSSSRSSFQGSALAPSSPVERPLQLPDLYPPGLRALQRGEERGAAVVDFPLFSLKKPAKKRLFSEPPDLRREAKTSPEAKGTLLEQLTLIFSLDKKEALNECEERGDPKEPTEEPEVEGKEGVPSEDGNKASGAESAFEAFKSFFTPKSAKRRVEPPDLQAVREKMRSEQELLRALFDRSPSKPATPEHKGLTLSKSEVPSPADSEERTPGRLQAVWPPPRPKDVEEKVGLKYTEAEHQAALLQLKRECKEEVEKLRVEFEQQVFEIRGEHAVSIVKLEETITEMQQELANSAAQSRGECREVGVSTEDDLPPKSFRNVCVQTDRETFIKSPEDERRMIQSPNPTVPKKLNLTSISLSLIGKAEPASGSASPHTPPPVPLSSPSVLVPSPPPPLPKSIGPLSLPPPPPAPRSRPGPGGMSLYPPVESAPRKRMVEPACPMKPLYWTRIQMQSNNCNSLWGSLKEPDILNPQEFEELFSKATPQPTKKPLCEVYEKKAKAKRIIKLLDGKRSQAVGILISSLHLEMKDIQKAVMTVDNSVVDLETIEALYENRAQNEELEKIKKHYETSKDDEVKLLDKPEQFLYELAQIPDFSDRAHCIIFQSTFSDGISSIRRKVEIISDVCKCLLNGASVRDVIGLILALGNYMNGGNRTRGQADGFSLEILPKLKDVKSRDNRINLVDYVASYYLRNFDENVGTERSVFPLPEPQDLFLAAQVKFEDLAKDLRKLQRDLAGCEKNVQKVCSSSSEEHLEPFKEKMETFVSIGKKEHSAIYDRFTSAQKSFQDMVEYFGVKPKSSEKEVDPSFFFMLWFEFCSDFKIAWKREGKGISKERLKVAQQSVKMITEEKKVETKKINPNSLKGRLRQKEATLFSS